jgi:hypothetical protein
VAPLRLGGLRGKKSTPSVWLGGTGELLRSASWRREQHGAWTALENDIEATVWSLNGSVECILFPLASKL